MRRKLVSRLSILAALVALTPAPLVGLFTDAPVEPAAMASVLVSADDVVIFRNGNTLSGKILEETPTRIKMKVVSHGIEVITTYEKSEILKITRAPEGSSDEPDPSEIRAGKSDPVKETAPVGTDPDAAVVYVMELDGYFAWDITQTPIRDMVADAEQYRPDYLVVVIDSEWRADAFTELPDDEARFDELFRAEDMEPIFTKEIPREWEKQPTIVFWVKKAMGGAAFLPLICENIYFHPDGKMGGIGNLSQMFGSTGDEVVRDKQRSLRMGHAEGMAIQGGYDTRLVRAMANVEYVLSYELVGGEPVYYERYPEEGETLLTDDGLDENEDTIQELARSQGNDVLTFDADLAYALKVSKGTVETLDDLIYELGVARNNVIERGRSEQIQEKWSEGLVEATRTLPKLWRDFNEIPIQGDRRERARARGQRKRIALEMQSIMRRYEEALNPRQVGVPSESELNIIIEQMRLDQLRDRELTGERSIREGTG